MEVQEFWFRKESKKAKIKKRKVKKMRSMNQCNLRVVLINLKYLSF